jgi:hypothetical protein
METKEFDLVPPGKLVMLFPVFIGLILPVAILAVLAVTMESHQEFLLAAPALLFMPLAAGALGWSMQRQKVRLSDAGLIVRRLPWSRAIKPSQLDLDNARILNLDEHPELRPSFKIVGTRLPGYRSGLFWLRDRRKATVLITETRRVLVLPKRDGNLIMLSLQRPEALLEALKRRAG